jgi:hypothetical protein
MALEGDILTDTDALIAQRHSDLCILYRQKYDFERAIEHGEAASRLAPRAVAPRVNLALAEVDRGDYERAEEHLLAALGLEPANAEAHLVLAQVLLAQGSYGPGWIEYEWRNLTEQGKQSPLAPLPCAPWNGMHLNGKLLIVADQGYGDCFQFSRFIETAKSRCQEVVLGASKEILPLLMNSFNLTTGSNLWAELPKTDAWCRMSSLPYILNVPSWKVEGQDPYLFSGALPAPKGDRCRVGLCWRGRKTHPNDHRRSMSLEQFSPIGMAAGDKVDFVSLQVPGEPEDEAFYKVFHGLTDLTLQLPDFSATARLIDELDLVITVDTAVAHLAAAMGKSTWILLPKTADWRWGIGETHSPWYPSVELFRQDEHGEWGAPVERIARGLTFFSGGAR